MTEEKKQDDGIVAFAETNFRNQRRRFGIKTDDRRRHTYLIGKTGMGKSVTLENMIYQDIIAGNGVCVVDPHGDLAEKILSFVPSERINDVVYFNPGDTEYPIAFNVLEKVDREQRHLVASGLVGVFKKIWSDSWGPRLEYVLRNTILALLEFPDSTLLGIMRMLTDKTFRKKVVEKIEDPVVKSFWVEEYAKYPDRFQSEAIAPIQNKVGQFLSVALIRNIVGQVKSTINMRSIMDEKKILIVNLSKGRVGEDNAALLGAMMITKIQLAAMSRVDTPEEDRKDFYLYVDEFQNFSTESFADILSEARKYRLNLIIAHQYIEQLDDAVRAAVFGNVGTIINFRIGAADAHFLVREFEPHFLEQDLVNLPKFNVYMKLMIDGVASDPFSATTLPPIGMSYANEDKIITVSRERYARPRVIVEDKIRRWSQVDEKAKAAQMREDAADAKPKKTSNPIICWLCEEEKTIPFQHDPTRPIYCNDCMNKTKEGEARTLSPKESRAKLPHMMKLTEEKIGKEEAQAMLPKKKEEKKEHKPFEKALNGAIENKQKEIKNLSDHLQERKPKEEKEEKEITKE